MVTAGTSDLPVAEEARVTAEAWNCEVTLMADVGVAGLHRLLQQLDTPGGADAIVVVAGMEGALPSVVGGLVDCPVIAVPTSIGYGASFGGLAALLGMLNSCASNVVVVNIDAGFNGGHVAGLIARRAGQARLGASAPASASSGTMAGSSQGERQSLMAVERINEIADAPEAAGRQQQGDVRHRSRRRRRSGDGRSRGPGAAASACGRGRAWSGSPARPRSSRPSPPLSPRT